MTQKQKAILEATSGIRDAYIEEAAAKQFRSHRWGYKTAIAAVLALVIGAFCLFGRNPDAGDPVPFFAIRAYAEDGATITLKNFGDSAQSRIEQSDLFPGKEVYVLDISLDGYEGDPHDIADERFTFQHRGKYLVPGDSDEYLSIQWLTAEQDGMNGYRIIGWCDSRDWINIDIRDPDGRIIHQKHLMVTKDTEYLVSTQISYSYKEDRTTDELIEAAFNQGIDLTLCSGNYYHTLKGLHGGFAELEDRPDAAKKLLALYVRIMEGEQIFACNWLGRSTDSMVGMVLSRDIHWNNLTQKEKELFCSYGLWRDLDDETTDPKPYSPFPGKITFFHKVMLKGEERRGKLSISCDDAVYPDDTSHFSISYIASTRYPEYGWGITGWFDKPTQITITVMDGDELLYLEVLQITPTEGGYQIDIVTPAA